MANVILKGNIKALRENNKWTQQEMADKLSISKSSISKWENGSQEPDKDYVQKYSEIFGCTIDDLMKDIDLPEKLSQPLIANQIAAPVTPPVVTEKVIIKEVVVEQPKIINSEILYRGNVCFNVSNPKKVKSESIWKMSVAQKVCFAIWSLLAGSSLVSVIITDPELIDGEIGTTVIAAILSFLILTLPLYAVFVFFRFLSVKKVPVYSPNGICEISNTGINLIVEGQKRKIDWSEVAGFTDPIESSDKTVFHVKIKLMNSYELVIAHSQLFEVIKPAKYFAFWKNSF